MSVPGARPVCAAAAALTAPIALQGLANCGNWSGHNSKACITSGDQTFFSISNRPSGSALAQLVRNAPVSRHTR